MYIYFIHDKSDVFDVFKDFKKEVEKQLRKPIRVVILDRGCKYYDKHIKKRQMSCFLKQHGIVR